MTNWPPIDGVDASDLLLGHSDISSRDHVIFYGSDGEVMPVKWKNNKIVFRYVETFDGPIVKPQFPMAFNLIDDPGEKLNLIAQRMDMMCRLAIERPGCPFAGFCRWLGDGRLRPACGKCWRHGA